MALTSTFQLIAEKKLGIVYGSKGAYIRLYARVSSSGPDIANNQTKVYLQARMYSEETWWSGKTTYYRITGSGSLDSGNISCETSENNKWAKGEVTMGEISGFIEHDEDGTRTIHGELQFYSSPWGWNVTASATDLELPTIPRYATVSTAASNVTQSSVGITWSSDVAVDQVQYRLNEGSWIIVETGVDKTSGSYTITDLAPNTYYKIDFDYKRKDSQKWSFSAGYSGSQEITTLDYVNYIKVNGEWKKAVPYVNVNGEWKKAIPYVNVNDTWIECVE